MALIRILSRTLVVTPINSIRTGSSSEVSTTYQSRTQSRTQSMRAGREPQNAPRPHSGSWGFLHNIKSSVAAGSLWRALLLRWIACPIVTSQEPSPASVGYQTTDSARKAALWLTAGASASGQPASGWSGSRCALGAGLRATAPQATHSSMRRSTTHGVGCWAVPCSFRRRSGTTCTVYCVQRASHQQGLACGSLCHRKGPAWDTTAYWDSGGTVYGVLPAWLSILRSLGTMMGDGSRCG